MDAKTSRTRANRGFFALLIILIGFVAAESFHRYKFHHFVGYGVHMDVVLGDSDVGRRDMFYARVWNLSSHTLVVEGCRLPGGFSGSGTLYHWDIQRLNSQLQHGTASKARTTGYPRHSGK